MVVHLLRDLRRVVPVLFPADQFPLPSHEGNCGPESGCDANCMLIASMAEYNHVLYRVDKFLKG